jgi:hypothetical protein
MIVTSSVHLGPAKVLAAVGKPGFVQVALSDDEVTWARLALAVPYSPAEGDEVLVIRVESSPAFVIGVLQGRGPTTLRVPGDLNLEAPNGVVQVSAGKSVRLRAGQDVELVSKRVGVRASRVNIIAETFVQRATNVYTWVTGLFQTKSRRHRQVIDEGWLVRAGRAHVKTSENIHINGKTIHLG